MTPECRLPPPPSTDTPCDVTTAYEWGEITDPYEIASAIYAVRVDELKLEGLLRRIDDITTEAELEEHFDDLTRVYQQVCAEMGLSWPPLPLDS